MPRQMIAARGASGNIDCVRARESNAPHGLRKALTTQSKLSRRGAASSSVSRQGRRYCPSIGKAPGGLERHNLVAANGGGGGPKNRVNVSSVHATARRRQDRHSRDDILEFPHIARPPVPAEGSNRIRSKRGTLPHIPDRPPPHGESQLGDVLQPIAERWHAKPDDSKTEEQIIAEDPLLDGRGERSIGRRNHADIDGP
jgi:hypothetical protein